jgi:two-component system chemotaxis response regulator CheB
MHLDHKIIVIGASTGGIEALRVVLRGLAREIKAVICVCQHMDRFARLNYSSVFSDVFGFNLIEVEDKQWLSPGNIFFAPPGYHLYVEALGYFGLSLDAPVNWSRPSIDVLFESAARVFRDRAIGVILTGANADGSQGIREIKRLGGTTIAQEPSLALASTMPKLAIETGCVDYVLKLEEIAPRLMSLASVDRPILNDIGAV